MIVIRIFDRLYTHFNFDDFFKIRIEQIKYDSFRVIAMKPENSPNEELLECFNQIVYLFKAEKKEQGNLYLGMADYLVSMVKGFKMNQENLSFLKDQQIEFILILLNIKGNCHCSPNFKKFKSIVMKPRCKRTIKWFIDEACEYLWELPVNNYSSFPNTSQIFLLIGQITGRLNFYSLRY